VAQAAAERGIAPQQLADSIAGTFQAMWKRLGISYDQFIRTTSEAHKTGVRALIERMFERNADDFYERAYEGWYCVGCELFKRENEIVDGRCVLHPTRTLEWTVERNWFFRLTRYQEFLDQLFQRQPDFLRPESRRNEILALLASGLEDISITRSRLTWAIPFPRELSSGEPQGTWVWFDALPNYLTATGYPQPGYERLWPADLHVIGKDITRLHCVIWPAMLESAGLPLPTRVWAHGFVSLGGERFSKSSGVRLDLGEAIDRFGADAFRYFLMREVPFDADGNFSWERFEQRYTAELANGWGNLASRTIAMVEKYCGGRVPAAIIPPDAAALLAGTLTRYDAALEGGRLHEGLTAVWDTVDFANEWVDRRAPWRLARDPGQRAALEETLHVLVALLALQARLVAPYMPGRAVELWNQIGGPGTPDAPGERAPAPTDWLVSKGAALFPRIAPPTEVASA
ncbi:MAG: methionine--tRNA ligase, partial [Gemmatimonadota bacterium]|nr:methionine--tRNA ligase [Gemmatimonadota bacterium]